MGTPHTVTVPPGGAGCEKEVNAKHLMAALEGKYDDKKHGLQGRRDLVAAIIHVRTTMEDARAGGFPSMSFHPSSRLVTDNYRRL